MTHLVFVSPCRRPLPWAPDRGLPNVVVALLALTLIGCGTPTDEGTSADAGALAQDTTGTLDLWVVEDLGPEDAAACPGALGCACAAHGECASGVCTQGVCTVPCDRDCDDLNPCTVDLCVAATALDAEATCSHAPGAAGAACSDGTLCTQDDACAAGVCAGQPVVCADDSDCTVDWCHPEEGCKYDAAEGACDDGDLCTVGDLCVAGGCASGKPQDCGDGNPCTSDECDKTKGCTHAFSDGLACSDGNACTSADACKDGVCVGGTPLVCDDGKACTVDLCDPGTGRGKGGCVHTFGDGAPCDDGSVCTIGDTCKGGVCASGKAQPCSDANPCTTDLCDAVKGCVSSELAAGASCDDGNACTTGDACLSGACVSGKPLSCDDGNVCTLNSCQVDKGCVTKPAEGGKCVPAANSCTVGGVCAAGACKPVAQVGCDDGQACTKDACDQATGKCVFTALADGTGCNDGAPCTVADACTAGKCLGVKAKCDDGNPCTTDSCDGTSGCVYTPMPGAGCSDGDVCTVGDACKDGKCAAGALQDCDDNNPCTDDPCDPQKGCAPIHNKAPCKDNNPCTNGDACSLGACKGGAALVCDDGNPCTVDICNPGFGGDKPGCQFVVDNKLGCSDGNVCTTGDTCQGGKCAPGKLQLCDDQNVCTVDSCDPIKGCVAVAASASCSDNDVCTVGDACKAGKCVAGPYQSCDDQNDCTVDSCDPKTGCGHATTLGKCDDNNACTVGDICANGKCMPGALQSCEDANACTNDSCETAKGCLNVANELPCDDGSACSLGDVCSKGSCVAGTQTKDCDDLDVCTQDLCYPAEGCKHFASTAPCDDGNACTTSDTCQGFKCLAGPKLDCDDQNLCTNDTCDPKTGCTHSDNGNKPFAPMADEGTVNSGMWAFAASTGPVRFTHSGTGWYALSAPQNAEHTMTLQAKVDLSCAFDPALYFTERYHGGSHWVEISDDNAVTWSPSLIRGGQSDYVWRRTGLDLKGYKGKKILVRFRAQTTSSTYWWDIRDIGVQEADAEPKTVPWGQKLSCDDILTEGPGWTCNPGADGYELNAKTVPEVPDPNVHVSTARFNLRFDLSKVKAPWLTFDERHSYGVLKVEARSPGGAWGEVFLRLHTSDVAWRRRVVDLTDFKGDVIELRFTTRSHSSSTIYWADLRRITFGTEPAAKSDLAVGKPLDDCADWELEDAVWECDVNQAQWKLQATSDTATTKSANGYTHYARYLRRIDLAATKAPVLRFEARNYYGSRRFEVSTDGDTWTAVWSVGNIADPVWRTEQADLGQFLGKKLWLRVAYVPHGAGYWWNLRNIVVQEAPKAWPVVPFKTQAHDCGAWHAENATWKCDPLQSVYQFRYNVPVDEPAGYWIALTNERVYDLKGQANPHVSLFFRHYYGELKVQASGDGVQWDDLYASGNVNDQVWRGLTLSLGAYKAGTVRLRLHVKPNSPSYWGEIKDVALTNPPAPKVVKPSATMACPGWTAEGGAWLCKGSGAATTLRYEGSSDQIDTNGFQHHITTTALVDLAGLKNPVLRARLRHYYGYIYTAVSTDGVKWHQLAFEGNVLDLIWREQVWDLSLWKGGQIYVRFSAQPNASSYWGEITGMSVGEATFPAVANVGDVVSAADLEVEGGWSYDLVDKRFEASHLYVNHVQSLRFKKVYDLSKATKPVLRFEHAWVNGQAFLDVSEDGVLWKSIWFRNFHGKRSAVMRPEWIDLASVVGQSAVHIRLRHYAYNYELQSGSYWAVSTPSVVEYKPGPVRKAPTTLVAKDFNLLGLWVYNDATSDWSLNKPTSPQSPQWVNSPHFLWPTVALDLTGMKAPVLLFDQLNYGIARQVEVSDDDGQTWQLAGTAVTDSASILQSETVDLSQWKTAKALLVRVSGLLSNQLYWWQLGALRVVEQPLTKSVPAGYEAKTSDWALQTGWYANAGLGLIERKLDAVGAYSMAQADLAWDLTNATAPKLIFEATYGNATRQVLVSADGIGWKLLLSAAGVQESWQTFTYDLTGFEGTKTLHVRLNAHIASNDRFWRVRNLKVVAK